MNFYGVNGLDKKEKISFIEYIRGIAALMVMLEHLWPMARDILQFDSRLFDILTKDIFNIGQMAVALFFMITGYLVPWDCYGKKRKILLSTVCCAYIRYI